MYESKTWNVFYRSIQTFIHQGGLRKTVMILKMFVLVCILQNTVVIQILSCGLEGLSWRIGVFFSSFYNKYPYDNPFKMDFLEGKSSMAEEPEVIDSINFPPGHFQSIEREGGQGNIKIQFKPSRPREWNNVKGRSPLHFPDIQIHYILGTRRVWGIMIFISPKVQTYFFYGNFFYVHNLFLSKILVNIRTLLSECRASTQGFFKCNFQGYYSLT